MADLEARVEKLEDENKQLKAQVEELEQAVRQLGGSVGGGGGGAAAAPKPRAATAKKPAAKRPSTSGPSGPRPATAKAPKSGGAKDGKELPKFTKLDGKLYKSSSVDDVPEERRTSYNIGKTKITVSLPEGVSPEAKGEEPAGELTLAVARGFNGGSNNNLYTIGDNVVYNLAGMGIVWNRSTNEQAFFTEHSEDVLSIAAHAEKGLVATGQADPKGKGTPFICIWNAADRSLVRKITYHDRGVIALAFSNDGKYLFSVGGDDNQTLAVWEVDGKGKKPNANLSAGKISGSGTGPDIFGIWNVPSGGEEKDGVATFATLGRKHSKLWSFDGEKLSNRNISTYEKTKVIAKYFNGAASLGNDYYLHCETGEVFKMRGANVVAYKRVTDNGRGVVVNADGHIVVIGAGGKHGKIAVWTHAELEGDALPKPKIVDLKAEVNDIEASAVAVHNGKVLVGLKSNQVLEVDFNTGESTLIIDGHKEETWGLAASPDGSLFASSALDKRVKLWSAGALVPDCTIKVKEKARSLTWSPDGKHIAVGLWDGTVSLIDVASRSVVTSKKIAGETVDGMAFSPDGSQLALASWDQCLYTLSVPDLEKKHKFKGHTSSVMHLQWSEDGKYIMTDSRDYEILFWNTETGKRVERQSEIMDVKYPKWNCFLGWAVQGIWAGAGDGTDINAVDSFGNLLVAGDDFGEVRLYAFPSLAKDAPRKGYKGHSSHVANVRFSHDGKSLYSAGGNDTAVVEWRVA